jgi:hypothetical protein
MALISQARGGAIEAGVGHQERPARAARPVHQRTSELLSTALAPAKEEASARVVPLARRYSLPASPGCDRLGDAEPSVEELLVAPHSW